MKEKNINTTEYIKIIKESPEKKKSYIFFGFSVFVMIILIAFAIRPTILTITRINKEIKEKSYEIVFKYEKTNNRNCANHEKDGYDIISKNEFEERHIEVKGTNKKKPSFRFLTEKEFKALLNDTKFYLYLVVDVFGNGDVYIFKRDDILKKFSRMEINYVINFSKKDFKNI